MRVIFVAVAVLDGHWCSVVVAQDYLLLWHAACTVFDSSEHLFMLATLTWRQKAPLHHRTMAIHKCDYYYYSKNYGC